MSSPNQLSFLPDDYLDRKAQRRTNAICAVLFSLVIAGVASAFMIDERTRRHAEKAHADIEAQYADAARRIEQVREMQDKQRRMAHQAELTASLLEKMPRTYLLAEITNSMPAGTSLLELVLESKVKAPTAAAGAKDQPKTPYEQKRAEMAAKLAGSGGAPVVSGAIEPKQYDVSVKLTGVALTDVQVAQFLNKLSRSKILKDVNLVISDEFKRDKDTLRKFQVEMMLKPDAEAQPEAAETTKTTAVELQTR